MPAKLTKKDDALAVDLSGCRGTAFSDARSKVQDIPGRRFDWDTKLWMLPAEPAIGERLLHSIDDLVLDEDLREWIKQGRIKEQQALSTPLPDDADLLIPWATRRAHFQREFIEIGEEKIPFNGLMQHQRPLVDLAARVRKIVVADDMGLGKTGSAISTVEEYRLRASENLGGALPQGPRLVVCPKSVMGSWAGQFELWLGSEEDYAVVDGATPAKREKQLTEIIEADGWAVVNWEQIRAKKEKQTVKRRNGMTTSKMVEVMSQPIFEQTDWLAVIADEVHRAKNRKAQATRGLWRTRADDGVMLAMSGTPLMNSPDELWAILHWLWPKEYTSYWRFYEQYVEYTEGHWGKLITGVKNPDALRFELTDRLVRRTQGQVLDLPGKVRIPVPIKLNPKQRKLYEKAEAEMWLEIEQAIDAGDQTAAQFAAEAADGASYNRLLKLPNGAARTVRLRQIMESPALLGAEDDSAVLDACVDHIMDSRPEPWIVFCEFADTPGLLCERLRKHGLVCEEYTGAVSGDDRSRIEKEFQAGKIDVVVGTIAAMYQGITLTAGNQQFWLSRAWVPAMNEQGEDRQNRIGQNSRVFVHIARPADTVATSKIEPLNRLKEKIVNTVIVKDHIDHQEASS